MFEKVYVLVASNNGDNTTKDISVFQDSDLAYATQEDYLKHTDYDNVELFLVPFYPLTKV